jgi:hypothetical protein
VAAKRPATCPPPNVAPNQRHIVLPPNNDSKLRLSLIGRCRVSMRTKFGRIQALCNELAELSLRQKGDGIVQHVENIFVAHPANGSPELISVDTLAGQRPPFPPVWCLLFIVLFSVAGRNQEGALLQDLRARTSERAILRQRSQNPCEQALQGQADERAPTRRRILPSKLLWLFRGSQIQERLAQRVPLPRVRVVVTVFVDLLLTPPSNAPTT